MHKFSLHPAQFTSSTRKAFSYTNYSIVQLISALYSSAFWGMDSSRVHERKLSIYLQYKLEIENGTINWKRLKTTDVKKPQSSFG